MYHPRTPEAYTQVLLLYCPSVRRRLDGLISSPFPLPLPPSHQHHQQKNHTANKQSAFAYFSTASASNVALLDFIINRFAPTRSSRPVIDRLVSLASRRNEPKQPFCQYGYD
ncbi:hypothetical protein O988_00893 [Pseudogymnoascus sp. VKM F-3808]|nr:hypothetical protein V490_04182 [Pseudogymnoascus sp. VKM F-3557]KFY04259.1 hypothetical protein O988_00893 [Pseudogymnoascus sp. VKM F-3808]KFY46893.1 hypothetical protein V495_02199 [Pseudogymnoascus sp. VKM F-4514 (FW-929)]